MAQLSSQPSPRWIGVAIAMIVIHLWLVRHSPRERPSVQG